MNKFLIFLFSIGLLTLISCSKDDHENEEELITTVIYTLTPASGNNVVMTFRDTDGDGGKAPVITTTGNLKVNESYTGTIAVLNESVSPADNISQEILDEALEHQFFFEVTGSLAGKLSITYDDKDSKNNPLGLKTKAIATQAGTGKLKVTLRHEPNKTASGVSSGNIANAGGETDVEVTFDVEAK